MRILFSTQLPCFPLPAAARQWEAAGGGAARPCSGVPAAAAAVAAWHPPRSVSLCYESQPECTPPGDAARPEGQLQGVARRPAHRPHLHDRKQDAAARQLGQLQSPAPGHAALHREHPQQALGPAAQPATSRPTTTTPAATPQPEARSRCKYHGFSQSKLSLQ